MRSSGGRLGSAGGLAISIFVVLVAAVAPLIFGSNNASTQMVETFFIAAVALAYFALNKDLRLDAGPVTFLVLVVISFAFLQLLPLGGGYRTPAFSTGQTASVAPGDTWIGAINFAGFATFAALVHAAARHNERRHLLLIGAFAIVSAYGLLGLVLLRSGDTLLFIEKTAYLGMATATFVNRNSYATFLSMGIAIGVAWTVHKLVFVPRRERRAYGLALVLAAVGLIAMFAALLATNSRMGLVACAAGLASIAVVTVLTSARKGLVLLMLVLGGLATAFVLFLLLGTGLVGRATAAADDFGDRLELYRQVATMIAQRPFIGFGLDSFEVAFPLFHQLPLSADATIRSAHSTYLALWVELGVVVGTLPMIALAIMFKRGFTAVFRRDDDWPVAAAMVGVITVAAVHSTVDFSLEIQANSYLLILVLMLLPTDRRSRVAVRKAQAS